MVKFTLFIYAIKNEYFKITKLLNNFLMIPQLFTSNEDNNSIEIMKKYIKSFLIIKKQSYSKIKFRVFYISIKIDNIKKNYQTLII